MGWQIVYNAKIGFKLHVTASPGFHSLDDWCFKTMWLFSDGPEDPADDTAKEKHGAEAFDSVVKSLMGAIRTKDEEAQQHAAHRMIQNPKPCTIRW